jgi:DNA-binding PadR family transcriptional regulator
VCVVADVERPAHLTLGEWAVLGLVASGPVHAFAIVKALAPRGELGRIWSVPTPVVYRAVNSLRDKLMIATVGEERSDAGPPKTMLQLTPEGRRQLDTWLQTPVAHMRDVRSELLLKLALLARLHRSPQPLVRAQAEVFERLVAGLEQLATTVTPAEFEATLVGWRLESARAVMRFLNGLAVRTPA